MRAALRGLAGLVWICVVSHEVRFGSTSARLVYKTGTVAESWSLSTNIEDKMVSSHARCSWLLLLKFMGSMVLFLREKCQSSTCTLILCWGDEKKKSVLGLSSMKSNMPNLIRPSQRSADITLYFPFLSPVHTISCLHTLALKTIPLPNLNGQNNSFLFIGGSRAPEALSVTCHYIIISPSTVIAMPQATWDMRLR